MIYHVVWLDEAVAALQRIYDAELDKEGLANVIARIGMELGANAPSAGESREGNARILFKFPLVIWFRVNERMRTVWVYQTGRSRLQE